MTSTQTWRDMLSTEDIASVDNILSKVSHALQSQYSSSQRIKGWGEKVQDEVDATEDMSNFFSSIIDLETASGVFLDWWGTRVGVRRTLTVNNEAVTLDDELYRTLIKWRCAVNVSRDDAKAINDLLYRLLGAKFPLTDSGTMTLYVDIDKEISSSNLVMLRYFSPILKPTGVGLVLSIDYNSVLGFNGQDLSTFNFGVFNPNPLPS